MGFWRRTLDKLQGIEGRVTTSDGSVFLLKTNVMQGKKYSAYRSAIRRMFVRLAARDNGYRVPVGYISDRLPGLVNAYKLASGSVDIGCQRFTADEVAKLKAWAFAELEG